MTRRRYWLPPSQQPPPPPPLVKTCGGRYFYLVGNPMVVGGIRGTWARCIREPWDHDGNHLADIPGVGLWEFPRL